MLVDDGDIFAIQRTSAGNAVLVLVRADERAQQIFPFGQYSREHFAYGRHGRPTLELAYAILRVVSSRQEAFVWDSAFARERLIPETGTEWIVTVAEVRAWLAGHKEIEHAATRACHRG